MQPGGVPATSGQFLKMYFCAVSAPLSKGGGGPRPSVVGGFRGWSSKNFGAACAFASVVLEVWFRNCGFVIVVLQLWFRNCKRTTVATTIAEQDLQQQFI